MMYAHLVQTVTVKIDFKTPEGREAFIVLEVTKNMLDNPKMLQGAIDERISSFLNQHKKNPLKING